MNQDFIYLQLSNLKKVLKGMVDYYSEVSKFPAGIYQLKVNNRNPWNMFKVNNKNTRTTGVVLVSSLLTLKIFHTLFYCFYC